jgi:urease accessory protein
MNRNTLLAGALLALPTQALAHAGHDHVAGFWAGLAHPVGGADHLLAMIGVGVLAGLIGGASRWRLPAAFVAAMTVGALAGLAGIGVGGPVEHAIAASVLVIGLAIAAFRRVAPAAGAALVAACALVHGIAHGAELPAGAGALAYVAGFVSGTAALHLVGLGIAMALAALRDDAARGARITGAAIALAGIVMVFAV